MLKRLRNIFHRPVSDDFISGKRSPRIPSTKKSLYKEESPFNHWKLIKELGDGAFGKVYQAFNEQSRQNAAVKVIEDWADDELPEHLTEIDILKSCQHENILQFYEAFLFEKKLYIFLEFCTYGAVDNIMNSIEHGLDEKQICFIAYQLLDALNYLHNEQFVIHRDVKASNILLTENGQMKLADFGISVKNSSRDQKRNEYIGTVYWMAPEVFFCETNTDMTYDYRADIWSFGITLIEMAQMDPPYHEMRPERVGAKIRQAPPPTLREPSRWSERFNEILTCCLKREPTERWTCGALLKHPFISNAQSFRSSILYLLEEFKAVPVVEEVEEESQTKTEEEPPKTSTVEEEQPPLPLPSPSPPSSLSSSSNSFTDEEENQNVDSTEPPLVLTEIRRLSEDENEDPPVTSNAVETKK